MRRLTTAVLSTAAVAMAACAPTPAGSGMNGPERAPRACFTTSQVTNFRAGGDQASRPALIEAHAKRLQRQPESRCTADGRRATHHHVAHRRGHFSCRPASYILETFRQQSLIEKLNRFPGPAYGLNVHQTTRSLPPSTGTCEAVVLANRGPHISAAISATSRESTSVFNKLLDLYCSTVSR